MRRQSTPPYPTNRPDARRCRVASDIRRAAPRARCDSARQVRSRLRRYLRPQPPGVPDARPGTVAARDGAERLLPAHRPAALPWPCQPPHPPAARRPSKSTRPAARPRPTRQPGWICSYPPRMGPVGPRGLRPERWHTVSGVPLLGSDGRTHTHTLLHTHTRAEPDILLLGRRSCRRQLRRAAPPEHNKTAPAPARHSQFESSQSAPFFGPADLASRRGSTAAFRAGATEEALHLPEAAAVVFTPKNDCGLAPAPAACRLHGADLRRDSESKQGTTGEVALRSPSVPPTIRRLGSRPRIDAFSSALLHRPRRTFPPPARAASRRTGRGGSELTAAREDGAKRKRRRRRLRWPGVDGMKPCRRAAAGGKEAGARYESGAGIKLSAVRRIFT